MMPAEFNELSPAKLNLFLKIINKREDGYHNLRSGITLINLYDEVSAEKTKLTMKLLIGSKNKCINMELLIKPSAQVEILIK